MFSLNWFKSKKDRQKEQEIEEKINSIDWSALASYKPRENVSCEKPYRSIKMVNDVLTVVLNDGCVLSKVGATREDFEDVRNAKYESDILDIIEDESIQAERKRAEAEAVRIAALKRGIELLKNVDDLRVDGSSVYFKGIDRSMPQLMVEQLITLRHKDPYMTQSDEYQSLKRFFMWCCLNPRAEVADKLYNFLMKNSFKITKQGFFAALRNVVTLHGGTQLIDFVSNAYNKVKAVWKKSPDDYLVFLKDGEYKMVAKSIFEELEPCTHCDDNGCTIDSDGDELECDVCYGSGTVYSYDKDDYGEEIGSLTELYLDLPNRKENRFTDAHTRTFDIRVGKPVSMDPGKCSWNTDDCGAAGLHFTSDEIHYVGCGDQSVLVLINPMKVVGIGESKGRCWEYLPIMTVAREEATTLLHDLDFDTLQLDDAYAVKELEGLADRAKEGFVTEAKKHAFNIPAISHVEIDNIVNSLQEMKDILSKRVTIIE
jgi:hypothetical protein